MNFVALLIVVLCLFSVKYKEIYINLKKCFYFFARCNIIKGDIGT